MQEQIRSELTTWLNQSTGRTLQTFLSFVREQGLTLPQMNLLMILHYRGPCEITRLVEPLQVGKSAVSQMVERLVQQGYVQRTASAQDRRARYLTITPLAEQVIRAGIAARERWLDEIPQALSAGEQEIVLQALKILNRLPNGAQTP